MTTAHYPHHHTGRAYTRTPTQDATSPSPYSQLPLIPPRPHTSLNSGCVTYVTSEPPTITTRLPRHEPTLQPPWTPLQWLHCPQQTVHDNSDDHNPKKGPNDGLHCHWGLWNPLASREGSSSFGSQRRQ